MIKKILIILVLGLMINVTPVKAQNEYASNAKSALLMEYDTGRVLFSKNDNKKLYPASTTKIMSLILLFEAINNKQITWDDTLTCSSYASSMGGSQIYLEPNEKMSVEDLFKAVAIASANDATVMLAEKIGGNIDGFVKMMNDKAKELKLQNTHFKNATGLHDKEHYTCAYDLATMARELLRVGNKKLLSVTTLYDSYIREDTKKKFWLVNTNKLLKQYEGVDGLKTGYTKEAKYCLVTTCKRNDMRLISVLMHEVDPKTRNQEMMDLLDYGYNNYTVKNIYKKNDNVDTLKINDFKTSSIKVYVKDNITYLKEANDKSNYQVKLKYNNSKKIIKGQILGNINIMKDKEKILSYNIYARSGLRTNTYFSKLRIIFKDLF